jgi:trimethylamine--corrinoid protein Co-methyltransferase
MGLPQLTVLNEAEIQTIHRTALRLLAEVGMTVPTREAQALLKRAGARVETSDRVYLPRELVGEALEAAPKQFQLRDRRGGTLPLPTGSHYHISGAATLQVLDYGSCVPRQPTLDDFIRFTRLANALPLISCIAPQVTQLRAEGTNSTRQMLLYVLRDLLCNTTKHCIFAPPTLQWGEIWLEMGEILAGTRSLASNPVISVEVAPNTPLEWDKDSLEVLLLTARKGVPILMLPLGLAGMSAPITMAGSLALVTAQALCGLMVAGAQMARLYGLPSISCAPHTDAKLPDVQVGMEKMANMLSTIAAGVDMSINAGSLNKSSVSSFEQMIIDHEMLRYVYRYLKGMTVTEKTLAYEVMEEVGPGGNFLSAEHTMSFLHSGENVYLRIFDRTGINVEVPNLLSRAHEEVEATLARHEPDVPEETITQLTAYADSARHQIPG